MPTPVETVLENLRTLRAEREAVPQVTAEQIALARQHRATWAEIATAIGMSVAGAQKAAKWKAKP